jgi:hypothetical protein
MKKLITLLMILVSIGGFSQTPIDYNNFNTDTASMILAKVFLEFRDTAVSFGSGKPHAENYPAVAEFPELKTPRWSDYLYKEVSFVNCSELINAGKSIYHVDREEWFKSNIQKIREVYYEGYDKVPESRLLNARLHYSENGFKTNIKFDTYEELAKFMIDSWEKSIYHKNGQRVLLYDIWSFDEYGLKIKDLFSCCVMYNSMTGYTKSVINFIK